MAAPTKYTPGYNFSNFQSSNPATPLPASPLDGELANISLSVGSVADAVNDIRRTDGALQNGIVNLESLASDAKSVLGGWNPRGDWGYPVAYAVKDYVQAGGDGYVCHTAHTSTATFDSTKWSIATINTPGFETITNNMIIDGVIEDEKLADMDPGVKGSALGGPVQTLTVSRVLDLAPTSTVPMRGSTLYRESALPAASWRMLDPGAANQLYATGGPDADPFYMDARFGGYINKFRNGGFNVWQRGNVVNVVAGASPAYTADGWLVDCTGANVTASRGGAGSVSSLFLTGAVGVTGTRVRQRIESVIAEDLAGRSVVVQFAVYNNTGASITPVLTVNRANASDNFGAVTAEVASQNLQACANGAVTVVSHTFTLSGNAVNGVEVILNFGTVLGGAGRTLYVTNADVRVGDKVLPPETRAYPSELLFCRRYFRQYNSNDMLGVGVCQTTLVGRAYLQLTVPMRTVPSVSVSANADIQVQEPAGGTACNASPNAILATNEGLLVDFTTGGTFTVGRGCYVFLPSGGSRWFRLSSEL